MSGERKLEVERCDLVSSEDELEQETRNCGNGVDGPTKDSNHLLQIFPVEIWEKVLETVNDPSTLECLSNLTQFFRNILLSSRTEFLFPAVSSIYLRKYHDGPSTHLFLYGQPSKEGVRWFNDLLKMRLVCRLWCQSVDTFYQNHELHFKTKNEVLNNYHQLVGSRLTEGFYTYKNHMLTRFGRHFISTHYCVTNGAAIRNPFLGRAILVQIHDGERPETRRHLNDLRDLLSKFGQYVWHCTMVIDDTFPTEVECYRTLKSLLDHIPNLKTLEFRCHFLGRGVGPERLEIAPSPSPQDISQMAEFIRLNPLPILRNLQFLSVTSSRLSSPFFQQLLRSSRNANKMHIKAYCEGHDAYEINTVTIPNVRDLSLRFRSELDFERFVAGVVNWPLHELYLDFGMPSFIGYSRIFALLQENWGNTLKKLRLDMPKAVAEQDQNMLQEEMKSLRLNLQQVSHLKLVMYNLVSLDILLPLKDTLEITDICMIVRVNNEAQFAALDAIEDETEIKLVTCADRPMESNIWTVFPKLKAIKFQYIVYMDPSISRKSRNFRWSHSREEWVKWNKVQHLVNP